ncbi:hypothetical protein [Epilithonimonas hominis]|uniref:hypothetical protein n=1 Tax=Epilithonimonas hominis TaxID=420404 RepID=UPI00115FDA62|nr:hypothetical protein [Epilithonimonas hominis]
MLSEVEALLSYSQTLKPNNSIIPLSNANPPVRLSKIELKMLANYLVFLTSTDGCLAIRAFFNF